MRFVSLICIITAFHPPSSLLTQANGFQLPTVTLLSRGGGGRFAKNDKQDQKVTAASSSSSIRPQRNIKRFTAQSISSGDERSKDPKVQKNKNIVSSSNDNDNDFVETKHPRMVALSLALTYFSVMGAKCALPSVLPLLVSPSPVGLTFAPGQNPESSMAHLLLVSTLAVATGKLLLGPAIDWFGGSASLQSALVCLVGLFGFLSVNQTFFGFFVAWIGVDFIFSSCWAAAINAIHEHFAPAQWGNLVGNLASGARAGNALSFLLFARVLQLGEQMEQAQPWRPVFFISGLAQLVPLTLLRIYCQPNRRRRRRQSAISEDTTLAGKVPKNTRKPSLASTWKVALGEAQRWDFWLHFVSRSVLMVFASFLLFVPTFMSQIYQTSHSFASQTGSIYALGCLLAVTLGSQTFSQLGKEKRIVSLIFLLGSATLASLSQLAFVSNRIQLAPWAGSLAFFVWGLTMAIPFYIPPSLYALKRGGTDCSATIADLFDIGGFGLLASFNGYVAGLTSTTNPAAWIRTFQFTTACSMVSLAALTVATWREEK